MAHRRRTEEAGSLQETFMMCQSSSNRHMEEQIAFKAIFTGCEGTICWGWQRRTLLYDVGVDDVLDGREVVLHLILREAGCQLEPLQIGLQ